MPDIICIQLDEHQDDCAVCGEPAHPRLGVPMYEGQLVGPDAIEWGGFPACEACYCRWLERYGVAPWQSWLKEGGRFVRWEFDASGKPAPVWRFT